MSENGISEDVLDRLEAEAMVADAEVEELTLAVESDIEETEGRVEELQSEVQEKEAEVEELQNMLEQKDEENEELREEVNAVAEDYAEELSRDSDVFTKEDYLDKFEFEELREKANELEEETSPNPDSGDPGAGVQTGDDGSGGDDGEDGIDLTETEELAASSFRKRARKTGKQYWNEIADGIEAGEARDEE